jgi:hypothetical protein
MAGKRSPSPRLTESASDHGDLLSGLVDGARVVVETLSTHGSRRVVEAAGRDHVFVTPDTVFVGFGDARVTLWAPHPSGDRWRRFRPAGGFRSPARLTEAHTTAEDVIFELRGLDEADRERLGRAMSERVGRRSLTSAHAIAELLAAVGLRAGDDGLRAVVRPVDLAVRLWRRGLDLEDHHVQIRVIRTTGRPVAEHFIRAHRRHGPSGRHG